MYRDTYMYNVIHVSRYVYRHVKEAKDFYLSHLRPVWSLKTGRGENYRTIDYSLRLDTGRKQLNIIRMFFLSALRIIISVCIVYTQSE